MQNETKYQYVYDNLDFYFSRRYIIKEFVFFLFNVIKMLSGRLELEVFLPKVLVYSLY